MNKLSKIAIGLSIFSIILTIACTYFVALHIHALRMSDDSFAQDIFKHEIELKKLEAKTNVQ